MAAPLSSAQLPNATGLAGDVRSMEALRASAGRDPKAAVQTAAKQFEALFMQELMKSMRQSTLSSGMLENSGTKMGTEMLDTQFANQMTGLPGGLSQAIIKQLERQMGGGADADGGARHKPPGGPPGGGGAPGGRRPPPRPNSSRCNGAPAPRRR